MSPGASGAGADFKITLGRAPRAPPPAPPAPAAVTSTNPKTPSPSLNVSTARSEHNGHMSIDRSCMIGRFYFSHFKYSYYDPFKVSKPEVSMFPSYINPRP